MSFKYSEYLSIDEEFEPVFNEEVDKSRKDLWKSFIPHPKFEEIVDTVIRALDRAKPSDAKSLWIYGVYGTGKTHAVFVIKHLLEDELKEIEDYFSKREISDTLKILKKKLLALREREKILVVFKSGAGHIRTADRLILEIQESICKTYRQYLKSQGLDYEPNKTEIELLKERLEDKVINWDKLIENYRSELKEISTVEDIKKILDSGNLDFVERLLNVLEREGISITRPSVDRFKEWLRGLFNAKKVTRILFIWDEFSGFFQTGAPLDTLQELAHITQELPFYLLIVTHKDPEHWSKTLTEDVKNSRIDFTQFTIVWNL